jgi:hypothetical protein
LTSAGNWKSTKTFLFTELNGKELPINMVIVIRKKSTKRRKTEGRKARSIRP